MSHGRRHPVDSAYLEPPSPTSPSLISSSSQTPLNQTGTSRSQSHEEELTMTNDSTDAINAADSADDTTYFLLDINADNTNEETSHSNERRSRRSSKSSTASSSSSVSAQVVIDHGNTLPRRLEKSGAAHLLRPADDESESDYAYSYTAGHREVEPLSSTDRQYYTKTSTDDHDGSRPAFNTTNSSDADGRTTGAFSSQKNTRQPFRQRESHNSRDQTVADEGDSRGSDNHTYRKSNDHDNGNGLTTVYTEEQDDLMDEMPSWDQERLRHRKTIAYERTNDENEHSYSPRAGHRRLDKRTQRVLQTDLQSHSWSRRESLQSNRDPGLSSDDALMKLLHIAHQILDEERAKIAKTIDIRDFMFRPESILSVVVAAVLLAFYIAGYLKGAPYQYRFTGALVESLLILAMVAWNGYLLHREKTLAYREVTDRAATIISALERSGMNMVQDTKIPFIPSMSVAKVVRDGVVRIFPVNLLVEGDVVEMLYGDVAPGRMKYIHKPPPSTDPTYSCNPPEESKSSTKIDTTSVASSKHSDTANPTVPVPLQMREYYLAQDQAFKPSFFGIPPPAGLVDEYLRARGRHQFILLETPLEKNMRTALTQQRPATVLANETRVLVRVFYRWIIWIVLAIALVVNLLRFGLRDIAVDHFPADQLVEQVFALSAYAILPLLPLCLPTLWLVARSFGNAQLLILFEALQISKTEYEDDDEVDEFDAEAPPPTKDVELSPNAVWDRFCALLTKWDRLSLTRSTNLLESLGSTTVICCLDREGTISNPFPTVEQLMFPNTEEDINFLDLEEDSEEPFGIKFEDQDWEHYLPCLKPIGLNFMLNTNCGVLQGRKRSDYHRRRSKLHVYGKTVPARQSCLCRLSKCIGFREEALQSFALRAEIYTFAPYHDILNTPRYQYSQYFQFEVPNALSTVYEEKTSGSYQLLTDGHPSLVLDKCSDYWDGNALQTMSETMEKKINDFFQNAMVHDMQCIAYAYRPINTVNGSRIPFLNPNDDDNEDPGCAFVVLPYKSPSSDQFSSSDSSSMTSTSSAQPSRPPSLPPAPSPVPSVSFASITMSLDKDAFMAPQPMPSVDVNKNTLTSVPSRHSPKKLKEVHASDDDSDSDSDNDGSTDYSFEEDHPVDEQEEETFYKEVVKGQIFLGMAALCHQPKQNVVDFIEDLGLAGIRFVYFSPTAERESKAFAERLGLETDWNSCILLSSPDDENCGNGYLQTHDIKAQLPRGIDQIRPHLENVDDIPLHVSLFAECTPLAIKEMIRIFQENGEVVCSIGNALNVKNTESFALSDISIAMEPMHTRAQTKGRLSLNGRQPPLAVGASLVSLPCGLFMQYETSLYAVTQLIRDARRLLSCVRTVSPIVARQT
ncbi:uncharacterized protein BYT42DRAFT_5272 [Radiomyces spectabilis]|uniref:uncharacterized protein n=1 Tax=Radiomyces spectabilis TaxID=64574 RepID=UPI002220876A|nr:uncharacterized protein BYT42DRAFT_5272 [Radiomyces spectabilis]KAI8393406.1 hypothetical protein BYT42DRAFT_5272 [Radiomyces spectabilis]